MPQKGSKQSSGQRPWPQYRSKHRRRSHDDAHAEHAPVEPVPEFDHSLVCDAEASIVSTGTELQELLDHLRSAGQFGYDSEFIGEQSYYPRLCVIQVATPQRVALVDPIAGGDQMDLRPFWELLADPSVEKIVHAGMPDLEPVARHLGRPPQRIFDTQVAAAFAALHYPMALGKLLHELVGVDLMHASSRGLKFSQWDHRPLTPAQVRYAANDVRYMPLAHHLLAERIEKHGNMAKAREEFQALSDMSLYVFDPRAQRIRAAGIEKLPKRQRDLLRELLAWRDEAARHHDVPTRSFLRDDVLFALANSPALSAADLKQIAGLPRPVEREYGHALVQLTRDILGGSTQDDEKEESEEPASARSGDWQKIRRRVDSLWKKIEAACATHGINPAVATSKRELEDLLHALARGRAPATRLFQGWRRDLLGAILQPYLE